MIESPLSPSHIDGEALYRRAAWRIIPFLFILYVAAYLDRANVGYAKLMFQKDLGFSDAAYGLGAGVFFIGYFLFEVPSNLILERVGARVWIARIMLSWGLVSISFMFMWDEWSFYVLRFLLGVTEAGFFPGMILYLSYWFPVRMRARMVARFMAAIPISYIIGAPLSALILHGMDTVAGLHGWQWMFLIEGIPTLILGIAVLFLLIDRPSLARWLRPDERAWIEQDLSRDRERIMDGGRKDLRGAFADIRVWWMVALYVTNVIASYGLGLWMPQIIQDSDLALKASDPEWSATRASYLTAIPWVIAGVALVINGWHSDRTQERRWHIAIPHLVAAIALVLALFVRDNTLLLIPCLCAATAGILCVLGVFWAIPANFLTGAAAAGGIAVINSVGNLGGFLGPYTVGYLKETYGFAGGFLTLAGSLTLGAVLALAFRSGR